MTETKPKRARRHIAPVKHLHLTPSRIRTIEACPLAFSYELRTEFSISNPVMRVGGKVHEVIDQYTAHCVAAKQQTDLTEMDRLVNQNRRGLQSDGEKSEAAMLCRKFAANNLIPLNAVPEFQFAFDRMWNHRIGWDSDSVFFRGRVDMHYEPEPGVLCITDYTTSHKIARDLSETGKQDQIFMYAFALCRIAGEENIHEIRIAINNIRHNWLASALLFPADFGHVPEIVESAWKIVERGVRTGGWDANITDRCAGCVYLKRCRAVPAAVKKLLPESLDGAEQTAIDKWFALKAQTEAAEKQLREHVGAKGNIVIGGREFGFYPKRGVKYDARRVVETVARNSPKESLNINMATALDLCSFPASKINALIKRIKFPQDKAALIKNKGSETVKNMFGYIETGDDEKIFE